MMSSPASPPGDSPTSIGLAALDDGFVYYRSRPLQLPPKEQAVLHLLVREWPRVVSKDRFARQVWAGQAMSDESLARCVAQLRQAMPPNLGLAIQSVYRRGYQLVVAPRELSESAPPTHPRLLHDAMALPQQVEALTHARQLTQQRTAPALQRAEQLLRELIVQAPGYMAAKLAFAECLAATLSCGFAVERQRIDEGLAQLALVERHAPQMPGLHAETAHLLDCAWRFDEAAVLHARARQTSPQDAATHYYHGWHLLAMARPREAVQALETARRLNPFSVNISIMQARALASAGETQAGLERARQAHLSAPESLQASIYFLAYQAYVDPQPALAETARRVILGPSSWAFAASSLAYVLARCGEHEAAMQLVKTVGTENASVRANHIAVLLVLGQADEAMQRALDAAQEGCGQLPLIVNAPENTGLRQHPGFTRLQTLIHGR
ncbi:MAG: winged helix-turn-helix domain-containing protein [Burkholderiaceae bacterium]